MSIELVTEAIDRFLSRPEAEVLCIRGKWGVGKTFAWQRRLEAAQEAKSIKLPRYSYVSLFGVNSLDELKLAIFENVIILNQGLKKADLATLDAWVSKMGSWRKLTRLAQSIPVVRSVVGADATGLVSFMTIRDQIICIDDLERRGSKLEIGDVLGLISYLREQRNCKVVLILNDEQLEEEKRKFDRHLEKVVDVSLVYKPAAIESVKHGVPSSDDLNKLVAERCVSLGITNIRVMERIVRFAEDVKPILRKFDAEVMQAAVRSIVLFSWCCDQPDEAPTLEFLTSLRQETFGLDRKEARPAKEAAWTALLEAYNYRWTDDFDLALLDGVKNGYYDPSSVEKTAQVLHDKIIAVRADGSFEEAWRLYHDSFENNQDAVLDAIYFSFMRNFAYISPTNLNGTITLFKQLGRPEQALAMLSHYMTNRKESRAFFDLEDSLFGDSVTDPDVRQAFDEKSTMVPETRDVRQMVLALEGTWTDKQISELAATPIDEYYRAFKENSGPELRKILSAVFQFDRIVNASDDMREISRRGREALGRIGTESAINARRVSRFGVVIRNGAAPEAVIEKLADPDGRG
jgi:hypothetical protein